MELVDVLEALEELTFDKEIRKNKEAQDIYKESMMLHDKMLSAINEVENEKLRKKLYDLFDKYITSTGHRMDFYGVYGYEKGAMIGQAFQYLKNDLGFNK